MTTKCTIICDDDCDNLCHSDHYIWTRKEHFPGDCPAFIEAIPSVEDPGVDKHVIAPNGTVVYAPNLTPEILIEGYRLHFRDYANSAWIAIENLIAAVRAEERRK